MNGRNRVSLSHGLVLVLVVFSLLAVLIRVSAVKADSVVAFPDPNLEAAIREAIGKAEGDIYESDLVGLTEFVANDLSIADLTGMEYCTSLTFLGLNNNEIEDISPLAGLTNLTTILDLECNQISDISPLSGLTNLEVLNLGWNQVSDLSPLSSLTSLVYLACYHNQISSLSGLSSLTGLAFIQIDYNQISDLSPISGLTSLTDLYLGSNQIVDLSPLSSLTNMYGLDLSWNQIRDIEPLSSLTRIYELNLRWNQIRDIEPLIDNPGIASGDLVYLCGNPLSSVSVNTYIPALQDRGVTVEWCPSAWTDIFQDTQRGTTLYINTVEGTFCLTGPDGYTTGVVKAKMMRVYGERIWIWHMHDGIIFRCNVNSRSGYCSAYLWDFATMKYYILLNVPTY